MKEIGIRF